MIVALWVSFDIFASGGNALGKFYFYIMVASFLFGLLSPKKAFFYLLFLGGYIDYFKRLMIMDTGVRMIDLYWVLGIPPATFVGIIASLLFQLGKTHKLRIGEGKLIVIITIVTALLVAMTMANRSLGGRGLGDVVNSTLYIPCLFVIPRLFVGAEEMAQLLRKICYLLVPSALYLIYQSFFGLTWWEHKYLQSGLSIESRQYSEHVFRCMGTMAGAAGATIIFSLMSVLLVHGGMWRWAGERSMKANSSPFLRFVLALVFAFAAYRTFSRAGWIMGLATLMAMAAIPRKPFILMIYACGITIYVSAVIAAPYLLKHKILNKIDDSQRATDSAEGRQAKQLATLNGRLEGFYTLTHTKGIMTPFGFKFAGQGHRRAGIHTHDFISEVLITYGYIPVGFALFLVVRLLTWIHGSIFRMPVSLNRDVAVTGMACVMGTALGAIANGAQFAVFPQNLLFYMFCGLALAVLLSEAAKEQEAKASLEAERLRQREEELAARRGGRSSSQSSPLRRRAGAFASVS
jgi:hypothetical protein